MALEYFLYNTTYGNTLVNRSNISFAPILPYGQIYIDYFIPDIQPLFLYRESGGTIIHNQQSFISEYINSVMPPATPTDYIQFSTFSDYSGTTATLINTKLASSNFVTYTGDTKTTLNAKAYLSGATFTGVVNVCKPIQNDNSNCAATTSWYISQAGTANPLMNNTVCIGISNLFSRQDHVHPTDTSKLSLSGGTLTGMLYGTSLNLSGDLTVLGTMHTVHEEQIYSTKDYIFLRSGNTQSLGVGMLSGIGVLNADAIHTVVLGADKNAVMRVGWSGGTYVALAGREDNPHDGWYAKWDSGTTKFNTYNLDTIINTKLDISIYQTYTATTASVINTAVTGATNGLTNFDGRNLCLGGTLNNDVVIDLNTCKIKFINGSVVSCGATSQGFDSYNDYKLSGQTILSIPNRNFSFGNLAFGFNALCSNTSGCYNVANGYAALLNNTIGCYNIANGSNALLNNICGCGNVANGFDALYCNSTGCYNTALGSQTLFFNSSGCNNVANGNSALFYNLSGNNNIATGINALFYNSSGCNNVANGFFALYHNLTGCNNIANGYQALCSNTTGSNNIAIGYNALLKNTTGSTNIAIGYNAGCCEIGSNKLYIANSSTVNPLIYGDFSAKCVKINGNLIITGCTCSNKFIENGTCLVNTYLSKTIFNTYTGTTAPAAFANKTIFNTYTGTTAPNTYLNKTSFNTYSGTTLPANYYNKTQINSYTGTTNTAIGNRLLTTIYSTYTGTTAPAAFASKASITTYTGTTAPNTYLNKTACASDSAKFGNHLPAYYLNTGSTALCATCAGNATTVAGCTPSCFLGATACAVDSAKLNNKSASFYLNTGSTITCAADSAKLNNKLSAYYLNTGSTAICATCAGNATTVGSCTPSCFLGATATALCATTAGNALSLGGNLANTYAPLASPVFTTFAKSVTPVVNDNSTCIATTAWYFGQCATANPLMDGVAAIGTSTLWTKQDHVHPRDTTKASLSGATFTGLITANLGATINGAIINLNSSSNFATNINDGTSTGIITLGGTGIQTIVIGANTGVKTINIGTNATPVNLIGIGGAASVVTIGSAEVCIGIAGATNGVGIRHGASRIIESNKPTAPITALNANCTLTITQVLEAGIFGYSASAIRCLILPSAQGATGLVQALPNAQVGDIIRFTVFNTCTCGVCICAGTGGTIVNPIPVTCVNSSRSVIIRVTSITSGSETISVY